METLAFYSTEQPAALTSLSLGTVGPGTSDDTRLMVYNSSDTYQAQDVVVAATGSTVDADQLYFSLDGEVFTGQLDLGDIAPLATSSIFTLRRVTPSDASTGLATAALTATPSGWSLPVDTSTSDDVALPTEDE